MTSVPSVILWSSEYLHQHQQVDIQHLKEEGDLLF